MSEQPTQSWVQRWADQEGDVSPRRLEMRRLAEAGRTVIERLASTDAPHDVIERAAQLLEAAAEELAGPTKVRSYEGFAEAGPAGGDEHAHLDHSPIMGLANPIAPRMKIEWAGDKIVMRGTFGSAYEGPPGSVHGGDARPCRRTEDLHVGPLLRRRPAHGRGRGTVHPRRLLEDRRDDGEAVDGLVPQAVAQLGERRRQLRAQLVVGELELGVQLLHAADRLAAESEPAEQDSQLRRGEPVEEVRGRRVQAQRVEVELGVRVDGVVGLELVRLGRRPSGVAGPEVGRHLSVVAPLAPEIKA
jgi:hypothetical protein